MFGPDAEEWRPERWLDASSEGRLKEMEDIYCVFGRGSRSCVGRGIAEMVLEKCVASVVSRWDINCESGLEGVNKFEMRYKEARMKFTPRER